ncbi:sulfotransferase, partial [Rheinheimera baltica]|uniref:sulfotransferase n=1 Tax=Rheinheimera baltica TaxID=67576 RepID=UPI00273F81E4
VPNVNNFSLYPTNNVAGSNEIAEGLNSLYLKDNRVFAFYKALHNQPEVSPDSLKDMWEVLLNAHSEHSVSLLSHEALTSAFFSSIPVYEKLYRIKAVFPNAKIIIVIRDQLSWLHSQYTDHPFDPINLTRGSPYTFEEWVVKFLLHPQLVKARAALNYYDLICECQRLFGANRLTVIRYEWLQDAPYRFYEAWANLLGVTRDFVESRLSNQVENRGLSQIYNRLRQRQRWQQLAGFNSSLTNRLLLNNALKLMPKAQYTLSPQTKQSVLDFYIDSNNALQKFWDGKICENSLLSGK